MYMMCGQFGLLFISVLPHVLLSSIVTFVSIESQISIYQSWSYLLNVNIVSTE